MITLDILSRDSEKLVTDAVAGNPNTPTDALRSLFEEADYSLKWARENDPLRWARENGTDKLDPDELEEYELLKDDEQGALWTLGSLAMNECTPTDILEYLSRTDKDCAFWAAKNTNTSQDTLQLIHKQYQYDDDIQVALKENPNCD